MGVNLRLLPAVVVAVIGVAVSTPLEAEGSLESRWTVRAYGLGLYPVSDEASAEVPEGLVTLSVSDGTGFGLDVEYLVTQKVGIEAAFMVGDYEGQLRLDTGMGQLVDTEDIGTDIVTLGANYHFTPGGRTDLYSGVLVAMSNFDGVIFFTEQGMRFKRPWDDDIKLGLKAGIVVPFGSDSRWSFNAQIRWLKLVLEAESDLSGGRDVTLDPFIPSLGIGYSF